MNDVGVWKVWDVVEGGGELGRLAKNQNGLGIYTEHTGTAGVANETQWISGIMGRFPVIENWEKCDG